MVNTRIKISRAPKKQSEVVGGRINLLKTGAGGEVLQAPLHYFGVVISGHLWILWVTRRFWRTSFHNVLVKHDTFMWLSLWQTLWLHRQNYCCDRQCDCTDRIIAVTDIVTAQTELLLWQTLWLHRQNYCCDRQCDCTDRIIDVTDIVTAQTELLLWQTLWLHRQNYCCDWHCDCTDRIIAVTDIVTAQTELLLWQTLWLHRQNYCCDRHCDCTDRIIAVTDIVTAQTELLLWQTLWADAFGNEVFERGDFVHIIIPVNYTKLSEENSVTFNNIWTREGWKISITFRPLKLKKNVSFIH